MNLFTIYVFIEIGGTGGGCFRYMYSRFLKEAAEITSDKWLDEASSMFFESGKLFSELGQLFVDAEKASNIKERIEKAEEKFLSIAKLEETAFGYIDDNLPRT
jgi:hypothetical protein